MPQTQSKEKIHWCASLGFFGDYLRKHDDWIIGIGVALAIVMLFELICVISLLR